MSQLVIAGVAAAFVFTGGITVGWKVNGYRHDSQELAIQKAGEAATQAAVAEIKNIRIQRVTVRQELEREIRVLPADGRCDLSDGLFDTLNTAITGKDSGGVGLPGADTTGRPAVRDAAP